MTYESKLSLVSRIEFIRWKLSIFSADVSGVRVCPSQNTPRTVSARYRRNPTQHKHYTDSNHQPAAAAAGWRCSADAVLGARTGGDSSTRGVASQNEMWRLNR